MKARTGIAGIVALLTLALAPPASAQEAPTVELSTPYPGVAVRPGDTASFEVGVAAETSTVLDLEVRGLSEGWLANLRGGGVDVRRVTARPEPTTVIVEVIVPLDAPEGAYDLTVNATGAPGSAALDLQVTVESGVGGEIVLNPDFPGLRGPADTSFTFNVDVENQTAEEVQLELSASGPSGWRVDARPGGQAQASTIDVASGGRQRVTVEARPPITVEAGDYEVVFRVTGAGVSRELPLTVRITGDLALDLSTIDQRLNATVVAGEPTVIPLVVTNTGTAPLTSVRLAATPPRNWEVTFAPEIVEGLAAGQSATVEATVTPAADALAGDYRVTLRSSVDQAQDSIELRTTVEPSTVWGLIGVAVIALTLGGLAVVFRRFGRR